MIEDNQFPRVAETDLIFLLFRARQSIYRVSEHEASRCGVTLEQATVMRLIEANAEISIENICRIMIREHHTITSLIARMVKNGLVTVTKGARGKISLALTPKGDEILGKMNSTKNRGGGVSILSDLERRRLAHYLQKITKHALQEAGRLEDYDIPGGPGDKIPED
ncbi:DNA-binding transcriptional regulator, MarR family [Dehalogenimonas formicexedens]|uniref:DNA-binding transcriptional regulator, MarR family n=1 Tax=Dehalogenimonas formicexedens TaxID=1839801 RepID=A0A1P8F8X2_9CHLR|nr:MarR family transcriptional regulator [Dehalogenimonas formicexedens]APV44919.1 DNA-binding transcriptional regulator, MarR family [Dehalogenimonas formicexedens]